MFNPRAGGLEADHTMWIFTMVWALLTHSKMKGKLLTYQEYHEQTGKDGDDYNVLQDICN